MDTSRHLIWSKEGFARTRRAILRGTRRQEVVARLPPRPWHSVSREHSVNASVVAANPDGQRLYEQAGFQVTPSRSRSFAYRSKVEERAAALQREDTRLQASEMLRGLIDSIVLIPDEGQLRIELRGNLAAMLTAAQQTKRSPETGDLLVPVQLVAGARNPLNLEFSWTGA